jgi:hypothetical protein
MSQDDKEEDLLASFLLREKEVLGDEAALFETPQDIVAVSNDLQNLGFQPDFTAPHEGQGFEQGLEQAAIPSFEQGLFEQPQVSPVTTFQATPEDIFVSHEEPISQALVDWQTAFAATIADRDALAASKHDRILKEATSALEKFYAEYTVKKAKGISKSKEAEDVLKNSLQVGGNLWESVLKQIEVAPKAKLDAKEKAKAEKGKAPVKSETARFKQVLQSLKNDPNAPGLAVKA